ncbi:hypothetical protein HMI55_003021 [Coelomomyces lativittatus]|nr:hypothetical protein HMI55_003021 [Coelomomyces lativittatus]
MKLLLASWMVLLLACVPIWSSGQQEQKKEDLTNTNHFPQNDNEVFLRRSDIPLVFDRGMYSIKTKKSQELIKFLGIQINVTGVLQPCYTKHLVLSLFAAAFENINGVVTKNSFLASLITIGKMVSTGLLRALNIPYAEIRFPSFNFLDIFPEGALESFLTSSEVFSDKWWNDNKLEAKRTLQRRVFLNYKDMFCVPAPYDPSFPFDMKSYFHFFKYYLLEGLRLDLMDENILKKYMEKDIGFDYNDRTIAGEIFFSIFAKLVNDTEKNFEGTFRTTTFKE